MWLPMLATLEFDVIRMARRSVSSNPESIRHELVLLLTNFEHELTASDLRLKVLRLVPAHHLLRDLGSSLIPQQDAASARDRILLYFRKYPGQIIRGDELMVVSGIGEWARRVRELRVEFGWNITTGVTVREMEGEGEYDLQESVFGVLKPDDYILASDVQDRDSAFRWNTANDIRKWKASVKEKLLAFFQANVGAPITGEELRYVAGDKTEWARRVRELRTEEGWPVISKNTGRPDLPIGVYVLEENRQTPPHDRRIPDPVRGKVLLRDHYSCQDCHWTHELWNRSDPRHLELHHIKEHAKGGENSVENLVTLCTVCHDVRHRKHPN